jgi:hypothetical protein
MTGERIVEAERGRSLPPDGVEVVGDTGVEILGDARVEGPAEGDVGSPLGVADRPYDPRIAQDGVRRQVTYALLALLAVVVLAPLGFLVTGLMDQQTMSAYFGHVLAPVVGLFSSIITFYFVTEKPVPPRSPRG